MFRLDKRFSEQILEIIDAKHSKYLGALQDGRVVLGGSAGSAGGTGDPPAGFWGQLRQANVTYDTAGSRACTAGSAGSASLVDNLDAIRRGWEICSDAIRERHIDWGTGGSQVSAVDIPFATTSGSIDATNVRDAIEETYSDCYGGAGGAGPWGQVVVVAKSGGDHTSVKDACDGITDSGVNKPYTVLVMAGVYSESSFTIPTYTTLIGHGESAVIDVSGTNGIVLSSNSSMMDLVVKSDGGSYGFVITGDGVTGVVLWNIRGTIDPAGVTYIFYLHGASEAKLYHCVAEATDLYAGTPSVYGFRADDTSDVLLWDCKADDTTYLSDGLDINDTATVKTMYCVFRTATNDVITAAGTTWEHLACEFDAGNITITGTETALPQGPINLDGRADAIILDADGDTSISSPTDDQIDFEAGGSDVAHMTATCTDLKRLRLFNPTELTISGGAITITQSYHRIDTEGDAASDDLDTINGYGTGDILFLKPENDARTVVVKHSTGNIWLRGGADISLDDYEDHLMLIYSGSKWCDA